MGIVELWAGTLLSTALRVENETTIYPNSVTTPPCTANGAWTVFARGYNATHMACFLTSGDGSVTVLSPAFQKDSNNKISLVAPWVGLSTWTESTWDTGEIANYFSMPDPAQGDRVLAGGIVYFLGCLLAVWWANARVAVPKESYNVGEARNTYDSVSTPNEAFER